MRIRAERRQRCVCRGTAASFQALACLVQAAGVVLHRGDREAARRRRRAATGMRGEQALQLLRRYPVCAIESAPATRVGCQPGADECLEELRTRSVARFRSAGVRARTGARPAPLARLPGPGTMVGKVPRPDRGGWCRATSAPACAAGHQGSPSPRSGGGWPLRDWRRGGTAPCGGFLAVHVSSTRPAPLASKCSARSSLADLGEVAGKRLPSSRAAERLVQLALARRRTRSRSTI